MTELSAHDKAVLNCVFNPNLPLEEATETKLLKDTENDESPEVIKTKLMEVEAVDLAEKGQLKEALVILNRALEIAPNRASIYNNRAQVYQYERKFEKAFDDLTTAIRLADENLQQKTLSNALCQRGLLHRKAKRLDEARQDFEKAAQIGSAFARSQLVELNPYAALCNQMLQQVMENLK